MPVTLSGMVMSVKPEQPEKACPPMPVTLSGMVRPVIPALPLKAEGPIIVTLPSEGMVLFPHPATKILSDVFIRQLPALWYSGLLSLTTILVRLLQPAKVWFPIHETLSGTVIPVRLEQPEKA